MKVKGAIQDFVIAPAEIKQAYPSAPSAEARVRRHVKREPPIAVMKYGASLPYLFKIRLAGYVEDAIAEARQEDGAEVGILKIYVFNKH